LNFFNPDSHIQQKGKFMKNGFNLKGAAGLFVLVCSGAAFAAEGHAAKEIKEDITRHRAMAAAHEGAAKCLESGKKPDVCEKELQAACKGLAVGKYCGMKHVH
jgi:hypothetical protein